MNRGGGSRASSPSSINRPGGGGGYGNNNRPGGGNNSINIDNSTNANVSGNNRGGYGGGGCCYTNHYDVWDAVGTATRPPSCVQTSYGDTTYLQCGSTWYQPSYPDNNVQYVAVSQPY